MSKVRDILGTDRDNEILQSFVRVGIRADEEDNAIKSVYMQPKTGGGAGGAGGGSQPAAAQLTKRTSEVRSEEAMFVRRSQGSLQMEPSGGLHRKKRKPREYFDEIYTDKDRAAAVSFGMATGIGRIW